MKKKKTHELVIRVSKKGTRYGNCDLTFDGKRIIGLTKSEPVEMTGKAEGTD